MNIVLIEPNYSSNRIGIPVGIGFVAANLKYNDVPFNFLDFSLLQPTLPLCEELIKENKADVYGIACNPWSYNQAKTIARYCRQYSPESIITMGGIHAGWAAEKTLKEIEEVNVLFRGESELSFTSFCQNLETRGYKDILGISYREGNRIIHNRSSKIVMDIDSLPSPYLEDVLPLHQYNTAILSTARGCPNSCIFCSWGSKKDHGIYRVHSINRVMDELYSISDAGISNIIPCEGTFNGVPKRMRELCKRILDSGLKFTWNDVDMTANSITYEDLELLKKIGCVEVGFGYESCHEATQNRIRKYLNPEKFKQAVNWAADLGIKVHAGIIVGLPGETEDQIKQSFDFLMSTKISEVGVFELRVQPGTYLYHNPEEFGVNIVKVDENHFFSESDTLKYSQIKKMVESFEAQVSSIHESGRKRRRKKRLTSMLS